MSVEDFLSSLVGSTHPGGCDDCDAVQTMSQDDLGIFHLTVEHDDTCPFLARYEGRA